MNAGNRGRRGRRALIDLRRAVGVVAVYAEIASSGTDSAFVCDGPDRFVSFGSTRAD